MVELQFKRIYEQTRALSPGTSVCVPDVVERSRVRDGVKSLT